MAENRAPFGARSSSPFFVSIQGSGSDPAATANDVSGSATHPPLDEYFSLQERTFKWFVSSPKSFSFSFP